MNTDSNSTNTLNNSTQIDATGLTCPVPLMRLKQAMGELKVGDAVQISVTDVHAELDFEIWCERFGHGLEKTHDSGGVMVFTVLKGE